MYWAVREEMGVTVAHDYGMTEVPMICVASPLDTDEQLANSDGKPIPGNEVRIVDDTAVLPAGAEGEIQVRGAAVCHGYTDPSLDADAFTPTAGSAPATAAVCGRTGTWRSPAGPRT